MNYSEIIISTLDRINRIINEASPEENVSLLVKEKEKLEQELNTINTNNRNIVGIQEMALNELSTENENITQYTEFIRSNSRNSLITSQTQVGKTNAIFEFVKVSLEMNFPVVISCDNKTNQFDQIYERIKKFFAHNNIEVSVLKGKNNLYKKIIRNHNNNRNTVIICLDNASQIENVKNNIILASTNGGINFRKFVLIHDEGDVITKDKNIDTVDENQSKSHQEWLNFINYFEENNIDLKRVFVSATPENVVYKYNIEQIFNLTIPNNYTGFDKINYKNLNDDDNIINILLYEQNKRRTENTSGVILYAIERKISDGHDIVFKDVCEKLTCSVSIYNGLGITARLEKPVQFERILNKFINFKKRTDNINITYTKESENEDEIVFRMPNISIADFYKLCKYSKNTIVITIGMDLLARGISFVSSKDNRDDALAATTMIYRPGATLSAVAICQAVGRITGTARPDLERTLYAPEKVINTYKNFNINQQQYFKELRENNSYVSKEIMETIELNHKLCRPLDRPKLGLKPKYKKTIQTGSSRNTEEIYDENKMHRLVDSWRQPDNNAAIARLFRKMVENNWKLENNLVKEYCSNQSPSFYTNISAPVSVGNSLGLVFTSDKNYHYIKTIVMQYYLERR